jgi:hypothetical protein
VQAHSIWEAQSGELGRTWLLTRKKGAMARKLPQSQTLQLFHDLEQMIALYEGQ